MRLLFPLGLMVVLLALGPLWAHLLRRRRPVEVPFPPALLVPTAPPVARRRARVEDRWLLSVRVSSIAALALLAALPMVRCQHLALDRQGGASVAVALIIDDSMSMTAALPAARRATLGGTRFEAALRGARQLVASLQAGDSLAIVLAGAPARVVLPATNEPGQWEGTLARLAAQGASDRATELDAAVHLAQSAISDLVQPDKRIVILSDRAGSGEPVGGTAGARVSLPLPELAEPPDTGALDCAVVSADTGESTGADPAAGAEAVHVRLACGGVRGDLERTVEVGTLASTDRAARVLGTAKATFHAPSGERIVEAEVDVNVRPGEAAAVPWVAHLTEPDAMSHDDYALVLRGGARRARPNIAVIAGEGGSEERVGVSPPTGDAGRPPNEWFPGATGGTSVVERALTALDASVQLRPLPTLPDRESELSAYAALVVDDPSGFGPEQREALRGWFREGGVLLVGLGPRAASPPLGATLEPILAHPVRWETLHDVHDGHLRIPATSSGPLSTTSNAEPLDPGAKGRVRLAPEDQRVVAPVATWEDGVPLVASEAVPRDGRGEAWIVGLPFTPDMSDLPLTPQFLALLDAFVRRVSSRGAALRIEVGKSWAVPAGESLEVTRLEADGRPGTALEPESGSDSVRVRPTRVGIYRVRTSRAGSEPQEELRAVAPVVAEADLTPRDIAPSSAGGPDQGGAAREVAMVGWLGWAVLGLILIELLVRIMRLVWPATDAVDNMPPTGMPPTGA